MNAFFVSAVASSLLTVIGLPSGYAADACEPRIKRAPVPLARGTLQAASSGIVVVRVAVNDRGRVESVTTSRSSGDEQLDAAVERAVRKRWEFDVSHCAATSLPAAKWVAVEFDADSDSYRVSATDQCFLSSKASSYWQQRTQACIGKPTDAAALARAR